MHMPDFVGAENVVAIGSLSAISRKHWWVVGQTVVSSIT
jgi:hypothetical protein